MRVVNKTDYEYNKLVRTVLHKGVYKHDRTGTGTYSVFGHEMNFNLRGGEVPLLTTKKVFVRSVIHELLWFLSGNTNIDYLKNNNVGIWDEWADKEGNLGPVYGSQWRYWPSYTINKTNSDGTVNASVKYIDQIANVVDQIRNNPSSRRIMVNAWNVGELEHMNLPPCHYGFQFWTRPLDFDERNEIFEHYVDKGIIIPEDYTVKEREVCLNEYSIPKYALHCKMTQRSADIGIGVPFNISQYGILVHMIAQVTNTIAEKFTWSGGDVHIYTNHVDTLKEQLQREPYKIPAKVELNPNINEIDDFTFDDIKIVDYQSHPALKMKVSV